MFCSTTIFIDFKDSVTVPTSYVRGAKICRLNRAIFSGTSGRDEIFENGHECNSTLILAALNLRRKLKTGMKQEIDYFTVKPDYMPQKYEVSRAVTPF